MNSWLIFGAGMVAGVITGVVVGGAIVLWVARPRFPGWD